MAAIAHPTKSGASVAAAITATGNGSAVDLRAANTVLAILEVVAVSGTTPNLAMKLQSSPDSTTWADIAGGAFTAVTAAGRQVLGVPTGAATTQYIRGSYTITGTSPSFTVALELVGLDLKDSTLGDAI